MIRASADGTTDPKGNKFRYIVLCYQIANTMNKTKYRSKYFSTDEINADRDDGDGIPDDQENSNTYGILDHMGKISTNFL